MKTTKFKFHSINRIMKYYKEKFKIQVSEIVVCVIHDASELHQLQVGLLTVKYRNLYIFVVQLGGYSWEEVMRDLLISTIIRNHITMNRDLLVYINTHIAICCNVLWKVLNGIFFFSEKKMSFVNMAAESVLSNDFWKNVVSNSSSLIILGQ